MCEARIKNVEWVASSAAAAVSLGCLQRSTSKSRAKYQLTVLCCLLEYEAYSKCFDRLLTLRVLTFVYC